MKAQILKHTGLTEAEFYKKYGSPDAFFNSKSGKAFKAKYGATLKKAQAGYNTEVDEYGVPNYLQETPIYQPPVPANVRLQKPIVQQDATLPTPTLAPKYQIPSLEQASTETYDLSGITPKTKKNPYDAINKDMEIIGESPVTPPKGKAVQTGIGMLDSVIKGIGGLKEEKKQVKKTAAYKFATGKQAEAAESVDVNRRQDIADTAARTRKALVPTVDSNALFPSYGVGTNPLGQAQSGGEIANTFAPRTLYDGLGYEPLGESTYQPLTDEEVVKAYRSGGLMKAQGGGGFNFSSMMSSMGSSGPNPYSAIGDVAGSFLKDNAGADIGAGIGEGIGSIFGPLGATIGKFAGKALGGGLDRNTGKIIANQAAINNNQRRIAGVDFSKNIQNQFSSNVRNGGNVNPQELKYFGEHSVKSLFKPDPMMETLRTGGNLRQNSVGDINALSGGHLEPISYNPYSDGDGVTSMVKGQTHEESNGRHTGVLLNYNKMESGGSMEPDVEAENNEPITEIGDSAVIFGNQVINELTVGDDPMFKGMYGKTFKKAMAGIAEQNQKLNKQQAKNTKALNSLDVTTPIDKLSLNSLTMNAKGIDTKYALNDAMMKKAAAYQETVNNEAQRLGINSGDFSRGKLTTNELSTAKNGKVIKAQVGFTEYDANANRVPDYLEIGENRWTFGPKNKHKSKHGLAPWEGNVSPNSIYGNKTASTFSPEEWDIVADRLGFKGWGNKEFQEFLLQHPESKPLIEARHAKLYGTEPFVDEKLGYGWAPGELLKPKTPSTATPPIVADDKKKEKNYGVTPYEESYLHDLAAQVLPWVRKQPGEALQADQLAGEMFALSSNQEEPVQARFYHPNLRTPYDISYQDQLNANQADFNQLVKANVGNPEVIAGLAAQKYGANSKVLAEQFRANQAMKENIYSQNTAILNDALQKNLQIADQQYVRQATAKSATKAVKQEALNSIASKIAQNRLENRTLQTYANMFPDYSYDSKFRIRKTGAPAKFDITQGIYRTKEGEVTEVPVLDNDGNILRYRTVGEGEKTQTARNGSIVKAFRNL